MDSILVCGIGAVSPAGWGVPALRQAVEQGKPLTTAPVTRPGWTAALPARTVPPLSGRPAFISHARLRRTSPIAQFAVAAVLEALGVETPPAATVGSKLGIILCVMAGCVNYSRRFYDEALKNPATASPLVFPETVFNAPASHIAALLGTTAINYTLVGDPGTFLQGLVLAADWLLCAKVDGCVVIGAEELDWLTAEGFRLFDAEAIVAAGAGALYLKRGSPTRDSVRLSAVSEPELFCKDLSVAEAAQGINSTMGDGQPGHLLCDSCIGLPRLDAREEQAWSKWKGARLSPKKVLGEGLAAGSAWQCVAAVDALQRGAYPVATVSVVGCNQQAIAAQFVANGG
jgi:3-oxoacyl-(acyl-carrier-protein) synthase